MNWDIYIKGFKSFLKLEKSLSTNTIEAYIHDIDKLFQYIDYFKLNLSPTTVELKHLEDFLRWINEFGLSANSQARIISGIKAFYKYFVTTQKPAAFFLRRAPGAAESDFAISF